MTKMPELKFAGNRLLPKVVALVRRIVDETVGKQATFAAREEAALAITNECVRQMLEGELQARADRLDEFKELVVDGVLHRRHEEGADAYHSLCGPLNVHRHTYRRAGVHNGPTLVPLELEVGIIEGATPALAFSVAQGYATHDMRIHGAELQASHRIPPSRTTLENMAKRIGRQVRTEVPRIEPVVRAEEAVPDEAVAASVGLDRAAVPMEELRPANQAPKTQRRSRRKPRVRKAPPPIDVNYRMAYTGTVTLTDSDGDAILTRRYAGRADEGPDDLVGRMRADVAACLAAKPTLAIGIVQDGAPEMWNSVRSALQAEPLVTSWTEAIDRYHLAERLAEAIACHHPDEVARKALLHEWSRKLDTSDGAIDEIEVALCQWYGSVGPAAAEKLWDHLVFIRNNKDRMRYVKLRAVGLPVGSGATEGACKSVIGVRTHRASEHWKNDGLGCVLTLRAMHLSDRLPRFWQRFRERYTKTIDVPSKPVAAHRRVDLAKAA